MSKKEPKVAIVHDWLVGYAGGDRVVDAMKRVFPDAVIYTLVYDPKNMPEHFKSYDIRTSWFQKVPFSNRLYKAMLPLMPRAFEAFDLTEYDLVLSSSSSCSKGVITRPDAVHICYCHTPIRYVWDFYYTYRDNANWLAKLVMPGQMHKMRIWDKCAADRVDYFIANSHYIAQRIKKYYRRDSDVIYPCCHINESPFVEKEDFYLTVGRLTWYKRVDLAVQACTRLNKRLVVIGGGGELDKLRTMAGPTIEFKGGGLSDEEVRSYYLRAKGFLFPGEEDFGITPVEAQSAGTPVLAYGRGGACESVLPGRTGYWFKEQTVESLADCIERFERDGVACSKEEIREHSRSFSEERFERELKEYCLRRMADWTNDHFDPRLFQAFVKSIGIYPVGSLVRLTSGRLGVVVEQAPAALTTPVVKVFFSTKSDLRIPAELVNLAAPGATEKIVAREDPGQWNFPDMNELWSGFPGQVW